MSRVFAARVIPNRGFGYRCSIWRTFTVLYEDFYFFFSSSPQWISLARSGPLLNSEQQSCEGAVEELRRNVCVKTDTRRGAGTTGRLLRTLTSDWSRARTGFLKGDPHRTNDSDGDDGVDNDDTELDSGPLRGRATSHVKMTTIFSRAGTAAGGTRASKVAAARRSTQIMPHCRKRSSSTRPEGRSGNGSGGKRIPADTAKPEC
ncbi:hypothetical protein ALC56_13538 [Trachymyrmex septentrionalis]|uniref:Uncharacterized protein n=1 Tax=Trachymyrmex septentrionalis TaxID=34720 RepID=A0A195EV70_9HYME|nr:hypothetical protein ALC56_13538 [Trachymyrmex septentrionalis]